MRRDRRSSRRRSFRRRGAVAACWAAVVLVAVAPVLGQATRTRPAAAPPPVDARAVRDAIARAVKYLYSKQDDQGAFPNRHSNEYTGGGEALVALTLLRAHQPPNDPKLLKTLRYLKAIEPAQTYTRCLRAMAFSHVGGADARKRAGQDVQWLARLQKRNGGWGYGPGSAMTRLRPAWTDASNTQLVLLALREAADAGVVVPASTWRRAEGFWRSFHNADGGWGYQPRIGSGEPQRATSHGSMTAAGAASYLILANRIGPERQDRFEQARPRQAGTLQFERDIDRALAWLGVNYAVDKVPKYEWIALPGQLYYYLFCLLRSTEAAGVRRLGRADPAADAARLLLARQKANGSWDDSPIDTAFAVLCLLKARAPIAVSRLSLGKRRGPDPLDASNVVRWLGRRLGRPLTWQRLGPGDAAAIGESNLLYINAAPGAPLPAKMADALKRFIRAGGTCCVQAPPGDAGFVAAFGRQCLEMFPDYHKTDLPADHPVFNLRFDAGDVRGPNKKIKVRRPMVSGVGDGCRTRIFILDEDVSGAWHQGRVSDYPNFFALAGNLVLYANGGRPPDGRFAARPDPPARKPTKSIRIARLKYKGDYDVCPLMIPRLGDALARSLSIGLKELPAVDPAKPIDATIPLVWLTGNVSPGFSPAQGANIRRYLEAGGTLLIDPAIGRRQFRAGAINFLATLFAAGAVKPLPPDSPIITGRFAGGMGADLSKARRLPVSTTQTASRPAAPKLSGVTIKGRTAVVLSHYGLTCSIEGNPCVENVGYVTDDARKLALNVILYAATGP